MACRLDHQLFGAQTQANRAFGTEGHLYACSLFTLHFVLALPPATDIKDVQTVCTLKFL